MKKFSILCLLAFVALCGVTSCNEDPGTFENIPELILNEPTDLTRHTVTLHGVIETAYPDHIIDFGFLFSSTSDFSSGDTREFSLDPESFYDISLMIDDLELGATYFYALYADNGHNRLTSVVNSLTMPAKAPAEISDFEQVNNTRSIFSAHISDDGDGDIKRVGFCWSEEENPTIYEGEFLVAELDAKTQSFELSLPLEPHKSYYVRAFAQSQITEAESLTESYSEQIAITPGPADNEIWYTSTDGEVVKPSTTAFNAKIMSNTYENGRGVIVFDEPVIEIGRLAFYQRKTLQNITIPDRVESVGDNAFVGCKELRTFYGKYASTDGRCLIKDDILMAFAPADLQEYANLNNIVAIGDYALSECSNLRSITLNEGIKSIGYMSFAGCYSLQFISIPKSVKEIGDAAFFSCAGLSNVYCYSVEPPTVECEGEENVYDEEGNAVTRPVTDLFSDCSNDLKILVPASSLDVYISAPGWSCYADLICSNSVGNSFSIHYTSTNSERIEPNRSYFGPNVEILSNVYEGGLGTITFDYPATVIGSAAFYMCETLSSIDIPHGIIALGHDAFIGCSNLSEVELPESMTDIGDHAFMRSGVESIKIPDNVEVINEYTFAECNRLTNLQIGNGVTTIKDAAFILTGLKQLFIPDNVLEIGVSTFSNNYVLKSVTIGDKLGCIPVATFAKCSALEEITIGRNVTRILKNAFYGCESLTEVKIPSNVKEVGTQAFWQCSNLAEVTLEEGVEVIGDAAFAECTSLTSITIPESVVSIGGGVFHTASSLSEVYCYPTIPPTSGGVNMFKNNAEGRKIYVPAESLEAYRSAEGWSDYAEYIYPMPIIRFEFAVDVTENSFQVVVTPSNGEEYYMGDLFFKSDYEAKVAQYGTIDAYMKEYIATEFPGISFDVLLPLLFDYDLCVHKGSWTVGYGDMPSDTEFVVVVYPLDMSTCDALSDVVTYEFKTLSSGAVLSVNRPEISLGHNKNIFQ